MDDFKDVGRNDPCPCGSGKKFKKCCGRDQRPDVYNVPDEFKTGTPFDHYMALVPLLVAWMQKELQFGDDKTELKKAIQEFERKFAPGTMDGITVSMSMSWELFDLRFGKKQQTICESFMAQEMFERLHQQGQNMMRQMAGSYHAWYRVHKITPEWLTLIELGTEREWHASRVGEPDDSSPGTGDLWFTRLMGSCELAYIYSPPFIALPAEEHAYRLLVADQWQQYLHQSGSVDKDHGSFAEACKQATQFWAGFLLRQDKAIAAAEKVLQEHNKLVRPPSMVNYDGDELLPTKVHFKLVDEPKVVAKLGKIKGIEYDENRREWVWLKQNKKRAALGDTLRLAGIKIEGGYLVADTNSMERATDLRVKLLKACGDALAFERLETVALEALPKPTAEERQRLEKEQQELNANPEVRAIMAQKMQTYYLTEWISNRIPALGNITPLAAAKTTKGREQLRVLLNDFEHKDRQRGANQPEVDWDAVRKKLGI